MEKLNSRENLIDRVKMVKAMEFIARCVNAEDLFEPWLVYGVADGDIEAGDLNADAAKLEEDEAASYAEDPEDFAELMQLFLSIMKDAEEDGGLYCGGVVSGKKENS